MIVTSGTFIIVTSGTFMIVTSGTFMIVTSGTFVIEPSGTFILKSQANTSFAKRTKSIIITHLLIHFIAFASVCNHDNCQGIT